MFPHELQQPLHHHPLTSLVLSSSLCSACLEISTSMIFCLSSSFSSSARLRLSSTLSNSLCKRTDTSLATWDHRDGYVEGQTLKVQTDDTKWIYKYWMICAFNTHNTLFIYSYMGSDLNTNTYACPLRLDQFGDVTLGLVLDNFNYLWHFMD